MNYFSITLLFGLIAVSVATNIYFPSYIFSTYDDYSSPYSYEEIEARVVGGIKMAEEELINFNYQVGFYSIKEHKTEICGGAFIHEEIVLTAAHCVQFCKYIELFMGTILRPPIGSTSSIKIEPENIVIHEDYDNHTLANDIAVIKLLNPVKLSKYIGLIPLAPNDFNCTEGKAWVSGWGLIDNSYISPEIMHYIDVSPISSYTPRLLFSSAKDFKNDCPGDSGGSYAFENENGGRYACGINSFMSARECENDLPRGHTSVQYYHGWITDECNKLGVAID